jgi:hypothetical protein
LQNRLADNVPPHNPAGMGWIATNKAWQRGKVTGEIWLKGLISPFMARKSSEIICFKNKNKEFR